VAQLEERAPGLLERLARTLSVASPEMFITTAGAPPPVEADEATIVKMTERVIAEAAAEGRVVLVGRGAQAVLAQRPNALHVYVIASKVWRRKLAVERLGVDPATVDKVVDETDKQCDQYVKSHYGRDRQDLTIYDLVLNAERLGFEGAAALAVAEARRRGWK
jgi:cytidylate kinase